MEEIEVIDLTGDKPRTTKKRKSGPPPWEFGCKICLEKALETTILVATKCGHVYCKECLEQSMKISKKCPTCQKPIGRGGYFRLYL
ncbi:hypothetical protein EDD86DRAFT_207216 [Gorgonomyces haynaldii]|nr:hypothetical protein EDD86DRAFT_207216 [Gorgonomyces haynaldii]